MNKKQFIHLIFCLSLFTLACTKDNSVRSSRGLSNSENSQSPNKILGVGFYADVSECDPATLGATYVVKMTGDLEGCLYAFVEEGKCLGNGSYKEKGHEIFVGTYKGQSGRFQTSYQFEAKFEGCLDGSTPSGGEIHGACQHPIVDGSGEGFFAGVRGRLDFWDNVAAVPIEFPYTGHLLFK